MNSYMSDVDVTVSVKDPEENKDQEIATDESTATAPNEGSLDATNEIEATEETNEAKNELKAAFHAVNYLLGKHNEVDTMIADLKRCGLTYAWSMKYNYNDLLIKAGISSIPSCESLEFNSFSGNQAEVLAGLEGLGSAIWEGICKTIVGIGRAFKRFIEGAKLVFLDYQKNIDRLRARLDENREDVKDLSTYGLKVLDLNSIKEMLKCNFNLLVDSGVKNALIAVTSSLSDSDLSTATRALAPIKESIDTEVRQLQKFQPTAKVTLDKITRDDARFILDEAQKRLDVLNNQVEVMDSVYEEFDDWAEAMRNISTTTEISETGTTGDGASATAKTSETDSTPGTVKNAIRIVEKTLTSVLDFITVIRKCLSELLRTASARIVQGTH